MFSYNSKVSFHSIVKQVIGQMLITLESVPGTNRY